MSAPFLAMGTPKNLPDELDHPLNKFCISYISPEAPDWSFCAEEATPGFLFAEDGSELDRLNLEENRKLWSVGPPWVRLGKAFAGTPKVLGAPIGFPRGS